MAIGYLKDNRTILILQAVISFLILSTALVSQYGFGLFPCELCLMQRVPYALVIGGGALGAVLCKNPVWQRRLVCLNLLLWLADAGIAGYHTGVEAKIFPGPAACTNASGDGQSLEELRQMILNAPRVSCEQPQFYFLGLTMAAWNALTAIALSVGGFAIMRRKA